MRFFLKLSAIALAGASLFFVFLNIKNKSIMEIPQDKIITATSSASPSSVVTADKNADIEPQKPLENPPKEIKAIYATSWSASSQKKVDYLINLIKSTELNAIVIDIKDFSGYVAYDIKTPEVEKYNAKEIKISKINSLIKQFHDQEIYVIARVTIFQDPVLARARPDLAIKSKKTGQIWKDKKGLAWIDPSAKEAWDYNIAVAKDAASRGFDEINFDYIRFASDGNLDDMSFPNWNGENSKNIVINNFFKYLRENTGDIKISADLFGLSTIDKGDLGIGQIIENAYEYFDYVSPMIYPSHYAKGILGYKNPAEHPYEIIKYSMDNAILKYQNWQNIKNASTTTNSQAMPFKENLNVKSKLRPWLQDFDLGTNYSASMIRKEINAVYDAASSTPELLNGFMLWDPSNVYTKEALSSE